MHAGYLFNDGVWIRDRFKAQGNVCWEIVEDVVFNRITGLTPIRRRIIKCGGTFPPNYSHIFNYVQVGMIFFGGMITV